MSVNVFVSLFLFMIVHGSSFAESYRVMTYNIRTILANDTGDANWYQRRDELMQVIYRQSPTILGLQEADPIQKDFVRGKLGTNWASVGRNSILYRKDLYKVQASGLFYLPADQWGERTATWVKFLDFATQYEFIIINNHWGVNKFSQLGAAGLLRDRVKEINFNGELATVLMGDLNCSASSEAIRILQNETAFNSQFEGYTFGSWKPAYVQYDYIFTSGFDVEDCNTDYGQQGPFPPSDHYPVACNLHL